MAHYDGISSFRLWDVKQGDFWKTTGHTFETLKQYLKTLLPSSKTYYLNWMEAGRVVLKVKYMNDKYILCKLMDCVEFVIEEEYRELKVNNLTTRCEVKSIRTGNISKMRWLTMIMDTIAVFFGMYRIYLEDDARMLDNNLDMTLLTVMRDNQTLYEKYGYRTCKLTEYKTIDIQIHKELLRMFRFDIFLELLKDHHLLFVRKAIKRLRIMESDIQHLHEFYIKADEYYDSRLKDKQRKQLQEILLDDKYPWYSMVDVILNAKQCMEKYYDTKN